MGLNKCIMTCVHHYSIIQSGFTALKILWDHFFIFNKYSTCRNHWLGKVSFCFRENSEFLLAGDKTDHVLFQNLRTEGSMWAQRKERAREGRIYFKLICLCSLISLVLFVRLPTTAFKFGITLELFSSLWSSSEVKAAITFNPVVPQIKFICFGFLKLIFKMSTSF